MAGRGAENGATGVDRRGEGAGIRGEYVMDFGLMVGDVEDCCQFLNSLLLLSACQAQKHVSDLCKHPLFQFASCRRRMDGPSLSTQIFA